jgi:multidrug efflux pump subunit AcrA (membrane-fusion protein)
MHQGGALSTAELQQALGAITALQAQLPAVEKLLRSELRVREQHAQAAAAAKAQADAVAAAAAKANAVAAQQAAAAAAVAKQAAERNRARQLNPACTAFWTSRGYESAPWRWDTFEGSRLEHAHEWPPLIADMREEGFDRALSILADLGCYLSYSAKSELRKLYDDDDVVPPGR